MARSSSKESGSRRVMTSTYLVDDLGGQPPVALPGDGADAAAVHLHPVAGPLGGPDVGQIEPQGAAGGHVLDQAAAAVDIQAAVPHGCVPGQEIGTVHCPHPVGEPGALGVLAEDRHGHVRVDGAHLLQDGLQNGVVAGVAPAVGAADHHAVPARRSAAGGGGGWRRRSAAGWTRSSGWRTGWRPFHRASPPSRRRSSSSLPRAAR